MDYSWEEFIECFREETSLRVLHDQVIFNLELTYCIGVRTTGAGAPSQSEILALSTISNKYVANTDSSCHMIQIAFVPDLFIEIHIS